MRGMMKRWGSMDGDEVERGKGSEIGFEYAYHAWVVGECDG